MLNAVEYLGAVGLGVTSPHVFRAQDDKIYVVKFQQNRLGTKVLVNEYLAAWFGVKMNLCFPYGDFIKIDEALLKKNKRLKAAGITVGPHFASQYLSKTSYVARFNLSKAINKSAMAGVMLFDHMFHNIDRTKNRRNLLLRREEQGYRLYAIDNSHLFIRGRWSVESLERLAYDTGLNRRRVYGWLLKYFLYTADFNPYIKSVKEIPDDQLNLLVKNIPHEWLTNDIERQALLRFTIKRRDMVDEIAAALIASIPDIHRRS